MQNFLFIGFPPFGFIFLLFAGMFLNKNLILLLALKSKQNG